MISLVLRSLFLDIQFLQLNISSFTKIEFIFKKYFLLCKEIIAPYIHMQKMTEIFGQQYYYDDKFGLAVLQGNFVDNDFLKKFISKNAVVIDVGANIGQFNLFCRYYLRAKRVYSFEPVQPTFTLLEKNCKENVYHIAVSSKKHLTFFLSDLSVWASVFRQHDKSKEVKVNGARLDTFSPLKKEKRIDLFKIDTEGAEKDVLSVSQEVIKKSKFILIETPFVRKADSTLLDILLVLRKTVPDIEVVRIGRVYNSDVDGTTGAADILFRNPKIK